MKKGHKILKIALCALCGLHLAGCTEPAVPPAGTQSASSMQTNADKIIISPVNEYVQQPDVRDYSYMWWKDGFAAMAGGTQLNIQTGYYGLAIEPTKGRISKAGAIAQEITQTEAAVQDNTLIDSLSAINKMDYKITLDGQEKELRGIFPIDDDGTAVSRIIESGRYMQCIDIMNLVFADVSDISGRVEIAAMPKYFSLGFYLWSRTGEAHDTSITYSISLGDSFSSFEQSADGKIISAKEANGGGLTFVLPEQAGASMSLESESKTIIFTMSELELVKADFTGMNVIVIPSLSASLDNAQEYYQNSAVIGSAVQIHPKNGREQKVEFSTKGYLSFSLNNMLTYMGTDFNQEERLDEMDRLKFTIENPSGNAVKIPVQFLKTNRLGVLGCSPFLRDAETGEPIGVQVQLSKNWHEPVNYQPDDPKCYLAGTWFHGYTYLEVPAESSVTYEFTMTYAKWGGVFAASHSQLCLAGWGGNYQQWESSSIGSFGESFCYDAEMTHNRGFITDIRPLLVTSIYGGKYNWTENVGGGNFLVYTRYAGERMLSYKRVRTQFRKQGPNLTEVIYRGLTSDGKIQFELTANLPRTDDVSRAYHTFKYTFLEDVTFDRLAFYQFGGDDYNDNHYGSMAVGNDGGSVELTIGQDTYSGDFPLPVLDEARYIGEENKMQRIDVPGEGLWVAFMGYEPVLYKATPGANRMLNVISYTANLNGNTYTKPSLSFYHTMNGNIPCIAVELSPPNEVGNTILKGSTVEGTVEFLNMPVSKSDYYGPSEIINSMPAEDFNTSKPAYAYAVGAKYTVTAQTGRVEKNTPVYISCIEEQESGAAIAEITVKGGMGYVPLTFTNVKHYSGYSLEKFIDGQWQKVDQSVTGNDYWQAWYDADSCTYELTYNVPHSGKKEDEYRYRLVKN